MPVSSEKNFQKKLIIFKNWLETKERYSKQNISIQPHELSEASGFSNETFSCKVLGKNIDEDIVLRIKPTGFQVFPEYDLSLQVEIMKQLKKFNLPVPEILFSESNAEIIGSEFYVMKYVNGEAPSDNPPYHMDPDGMMGKASPDQIKSVWLGWLKNLVSFHKINFEELELSLINKRSSEKSHLESDLQYYKSFMEWGMDGEVNTFLEEVFFWLAENIPSSSNPKKLCWGDSRIGNVLFEDFQVKSLLDWEMATIGDPLCDLAWGLTTDDVSSHGLNIEKLPGTISNDEAIKFWEKRTGFSAEHFFYYRILCLFKFSVIMIRVAKKLIHSEIMPLDSDFHVNNHVSNYLKQEFNENN
jgi:aminoglycoside phosphotransferase (APT) family kinase protein